MSNGGGEGVGGVVGTWFFGEVKMNANHFLHLRFTGGTIAGQNFFDFVWGVFKNRDFKLSGNEQDDTTRFGDHDTSGDVFRKEEFFNGNDIGFGRFKDFAKGIVEFEEAAREFAVFGSSDDAIIERFSVSTGFGLNEAETATADTWVYTENLHDIVVA